LGESALNYATLEEICKEFVKRNQEEGRRTGRYQIHQFGRQGAAHEKSGEEGEGRTENGEDEE